MSDAYRIALLPGDGIGPDVVDEAVKVLRAVEPSIDAAFDFTEFSVGAGEYLRSGDPLPESTFARLKDFDAILLGAMGLPGVRWPDGTEMTFPQIDLREKLDLYCGLRPIRLYHETHSPLKGVKADEIDFLILRENTEGLFFSRLNKPKLECNGGSRYHAHLKRAKRTTLSLGICAGAKTTQTRNPGRQSECSAINGLLPAYLR